MNAADILADLRRRGVALRVEGDRLRWRAPAGTLTDADRAAIRAGKAELLSILAGELEAARADLLAWGKAYLWVLVRVGDLVIERGETAWREWVARASAADVAEVRTRVCFWQEGEAEKYGAAASAVEVSG